MAAKRILLVEDEEDIAEILALVLRSEGYIVDTAGTLAQRDSGSTQSGIRW
jgi:DNA-binding response OmpR family regulator